MSNKSNTPALIITQQSRTGLFRGSRQKGGFIPSIPGRERCGRSAQVKEPCGRIWPNGEFGIAYRSKRSEVEPLPAAPYVGNGWTSATIRHGVNQSRWSLWPDGEAAWPDAPWLVKSPKSSHRPETYGRKGITAYGSKVVRSGAYLLQKKYGRRRLSFGTLTLPEVDTKELAMFAANWGELVRQLVQWLSRKLLAFGLPSSIVLVTECQPRRLQDGSLGCLHLHFVFVGCFRPGTWAVSYLELRSWWLRALARLAGRPIYSESCENLKTVEKSAENYLGKYMSKGGSSPEELAKIAGWDCVPRQWWSATQRIKNAVKKYTFSGEVFMKLLDEMLYNYWKQGGNAKCGGFKFARPITFTMDSGGEGLCGFFGRLDAETMQDLTELRMALKSP